MNHEAPVPKDRFTALDTLALAREIRPILPARVDKAFDLAAEGYSLTLRSAGAGRHELLLIPGVYAALVNTAAPHREELSAVARELRRLLAGAVVSEVLEPKGERYLELHLRRADLADPLVVATELFGAGNLVVVEEGTIRFALRTKTWAHREVRRGARYQAPPARRDPWSMSAEELARELERSRADRVSTLAARLALGGSLAEEVLARAQIPGREPAPLDAPQVAQSLVRALHELTRFADPPQGYLYGAEGNWHDFSPVPSTRWTGRDDSFESVLDRFSDAVARYFAAIRPAAPPAPGSREDRRAALDRLREQQESAVRALEAEAAQRIAEADAIFVEYAEIEARLRAAATQSDGEAHLVTVVLAGREVPLRPDLSPRESAQLLYEEAKRVQGKLAGARRALEETASQRIDIERSSTSDTDSGVAPHPTLRARKPHWFERYRWFLSSEGLIVIGGHDAATNDFIVRRYLNSGDRYVHADVHGAPSVIVKHPPPGAPTATDVTMTQAGQWGLAFSKAWRAGLASGSAFWVEADQVSKTPETGEFVPRGAWVVRGTKHPLRDLPNELAIGSVAYEGEELWMVAPPSAFGRGGGVRFLLAPGPERERPEREVELARELGLGRARLQPMLPAGGLTVRRA